jgi:hypothetical protein
VYIHYSPSGIPFNDILSTKKVMGRQFDRTQAAATYREFISANVDTATTAEASFHCRLYLSSSIRIYKYYQLCIITTNERRNITTNIVLLWLIRHTHHTIYIP